MRKVGRYEALGLLEHSGHLTRITSGLSVMRGNSSWEVTKLKISARCGRKCLEMKGPSEGSGMMSAVRGDDDLEKEFFLESPRLEKEVFSVELVWLLLYGWLLYGWPLLYGWLLLHGWQGFEQR